VEQVRDSCSTGYDGTLASPAWTSGSKRSGTRDGPVRICNYSSASFLIISSENYPNNYRPNTDCVYRINKRDNRVCALEFYFQDFSVGSWETDSSRSQVCYNDFVKIGNQYFCGFRKNERIVQEFPNGIDFIDIRFFTDDLVNYPGFVMEVRQIDVCGGGLFLGTGSGSGSFRSGRKIPVDIPPQFQDREKGVVTNLVPLLPSNPAPTGGPFCGTKTFSEESFDILSPGFNDPKNRYEPYTDCHYTIKKVHFTVCALEVRFNILALEGEDAEKQCSRDYLQLGPEVKVCGKLAKPTTSKLFFFFNSSNDVSWQEHTSFHRTSLS